MLRNGDKDEKHALRHTHTLARWFVNTRPAATVLRELGAVRGHDGNHQEAGKPPGPWEPRASDLSSKACCENWVGCFIFLALITAKCFTWSPPATPTSLTSRLFIAHPVGPLSTLRKCTFSPKHPGPAPVSCEGLQRGDAAPDV